MAMASNTDEDLSPSPDTPSLSKRRKSAHVLSPLLLQRNMSSDGCTPEEVQQAQVAGVAVYTEFLEQHLQVEGISDQNLAEVIETVENHRRTATSSISQNSDACHTQKTTSQSISKWREKGKTLHKIAVEFEKTAERQKVKREANRVVSEEADIDKEQFLALLGGFFQEDRITPHRIVVLFTFCSDVIVLAVKKFASDLFAKFLDWAIEYIMDKVCAWVARHGGWDVVLREPWTLIYAAAKVLVAGVLVYAGYRLVKSGLDSLSKK